MVYLFSLLCWVLGKVFFLVVIFSSAVTFCNSTYPMRFPFPLLSSWFSWFLLLSFLASCLFLRIAIINVYRSCMSVSLDINFSLNRSLFPFITVFTCVMLFDCATQTGSKAPSKSACWFVFPTSLLGGWIKPRSVKFLLLLSQIT